ncbi:hypothetical protein [Dyadobacter sp. LHD-138]|uniref:hypothetical protein n=1 Tax=Dyadobacter sp. LHD-138 TaxID=3071413 RepID=UPI0027DECFDB|nr:hypothetical protein [Dyadobacter sp. LHD-138]MDQ6476838.1 hypothetical protein [Dyadobacter sp. LHD-138]
MKNTINILAGAMIAMTISTYATANTEEKVIVSSVNNSLPVSVKPLETPAPQKVTVTKAQNYTAPQKASIVELKLKSDSNK